MRWMILAGLLLLVTPVNATTMHCTGFAFIVADLTCETKDPPVKAAPFCDVMNQQGGAIRWSRNDTNETKNRADLVNAAGKRLCGWKK